MKLQGKTGKWADSWRHCHVFTRRNWQIERQEKE